MIFDYFARLIVRIDDVTRLPGAGSLKNKRHLFIDAKSIMVLDMMISIVELFRVCLAFKHRRETNNSTTKVLCFPIYVSRMNRITLLTIATHALIAFSLYFLIAVNP